MKGLRPLALGLTLGTSLGFIGFSSWDEVHNMFVLADLRLLLTFVSGVTLMGGFLLWARRRGPEMPARPIHRGTVVGGVLFGAGWALSGACPSIAFVQLGEGQLLALFTVLGVVMGNTAYGLLRRPLHLPAAPSCAE